MGEHNDEETKDSERFQPKDATSVLLTPPDQASSDLAVSGTTKTAPMIRPENAVVVNVTRLAIYREY